MGVPAWCAVNLLSSAARVDGQGLSGGEPNIWGVTQLDAAFPAEQLYDWRPGTVGRFTSAAARALVVELATGASYDTVWLCNHNLPTDATLALMTSATGALGTWTTRWTASAAELGETDLVKALTAPLSDKYAALVLSALGSLTDPWEAGEWGLGLRAELPRGFEFDAVPRGRVGRRVVARSQYGFVQAKFLGAGRSYEGLIGLGEDDAGVDELEELVVGTNYGASPFLWIQDVAASVGICATAEGLEAFEPRLLAPDVYASISIRIDEVPRGRGTV